MGLKKTDILILKSLAMNSKLSNRQLGKICNLSKDTVPLRVENLVDSGLIKGFSVGINYEKLGFIEYNLLVRLKDLSNEFYLGIIDFLEKHSCVTWIGKSFGKYDLKISVLVKKIGDINLFLNEISIGFGDGVDVIDSLLVVDKFKSSKQNFLRMLFGDVGSSVDLGVCFNGDSGNVVNLDSLDKKILFSVAENPKISYVDLSQKFDLTAEGIKYRVLKLEKSGVISGYSIVINGNKLNSIWCLVLVSISPHKLVDFKNYLRSCENLTSYVETQGVWNLSVTFFAKDINELHENLNELRSKYSQDIRNFEFMFFFDFYKFPKPPVCILE